MYLLKISINNHPLLYIHINNDPLLYIHINTQNNYQKHPKYFTMIPIKLSNTKQNNEIEHINKEISLLQDRLKKKV